LNNKHHFEKDGKEVADIEHEENESQDLHEKPEPQDTLIVDVIVGTEVLTVFVLFDFALLDLDF